MNILAYAVKPLYSGTKGVPFEELDETGVFVAYPCYGFLHYWVDEKLQYGEEVKQTGEADGVIFVESRHRVILESPRNYRIEYGN